MISAIAKKPLNYRIDDSSSVIQCSPYQAVTGKLYCLKQHFLLPATAWSDTKIQYTHKLFKKISKLLFKPILTRKGSKCRKAKSIVIVFPLITLFKCWLIPFKARQANNFFSWVSVANPGDPRGWGYDKHPLEWKFLVDGVSKAKVPSVWRGEGRVWIIQFCQMLSKIFWHGIWKDCI